MITLKLITQTLQQKMAGDIPQSCYHVKGHGGLKKSVSHTHASIADHYFVMRSDIKSYYQSIRFDVLMGIIETYVQHPVLLNLLYKALNRKETRGGLYYEYERGIPKGSPLSPLLGAIALIPLDKAMGNIRNIFYARFMDDWVVMTKSKTALRKVIKITHQVMTDLKLQLHPTKTYIGKISHGINFLGYYMDDHKILPSKETIRRFHERGTALYEQGQGNRNISHRKNKNPQYRDISEYQVDEPAPTEKYVKNSLNHLFALAAQKPETLAPMRRYLRKWTSWLTLGLSMRDEFETSVQILLPSLFSCLRP